MLLENRNCGCMQNNQPSCECMGNNLKYADALVKAKFPEIIKKQK